MDPWKRRFLLETIISRFHVNFWGCKYNRRLKRSQSGFILLYSPWAYTPPAHFRKSCPTPTRPTHIGSPSFVLPASNGSSETSSTKTHPVNAKGRYGITQWVEDLKLHKNLLYLLSKNIKVVFHLRSRESSSSGLFTTSISSQSSLLRFPLAFAGFCLNRPSSPYRFETRTSLSMGTGSTANHTMWGQMTLVSFHRQQYKAPKCVQLFGPAEIIR